MIPKKLLEFWWQRQNSIIYSMVDVYAGLSHKFLGKPLSRLSAFSVIALAKNKRAWLLGWSLQRQEWCAIICQDLIEGHTRCTPTKRWGHAIRPRYWTDQELVELAKEKITSMHLHWWFHSKEIWFLYFSFNKRRHSRSSSILFTRFLWTNPWYMTHQRWTRNFLCTF